MVQKRATAGMVKRALVVLCFFFLISTVLVVSLFKLQVLKYDEYQRRVLDQMTVETTVNPSRGNIYDTNGNLLATNKTVWLVFISPHDIALMKKNAEKAYEDAKAEGGTVLAKWKENKLAQAYMNIDEIIAEYLSKVLNVEYSFVMEKSGFVNRRYEVMERNIEKETADLVRAFIDEYGLTDQIHLVASSKRYYTCESLASHVIGFTNSDGIGIYGIEKTYNNIMEGTSGKYITAQDARSGDMAFEYETYIEAENGYNIVTTLDIYIQHELENQLKAALNDSKANDRVCGIVMDVKTGAILAMATASNFNLNDPYTLDDISQSKLLGYVQGTKEYTDKYYELLYSMWNNKAVTNLYEPGSTFKIITTAMAFEEDAVKTTDRFFCSGSLKVEGYGRPIGCHRIVGHGSISFAEGLQQSCNPTLMTIAARLGRERFYHYFLAFGYAGKTGIDLPGEATPIYHPYSGFNTVELAVYSFGQTFKTTPIQQITAIAAVANGGYLVTPHVMKEIVDNDGNVIESFDTEVKRQVVSEETCKIITQILEEGVSGNGGAKNAYVKGYRVAAKTGTSQKRDKLDEFGGDTLRVGSCVAYAPADDPQIAVIIVVDEPSSGSVYGSVVAAPYVSNLLNLVLPYMGIEPQYTEKELKSMEVSISNYVGSTVDNAIADLGWRGIKYEIIGSGDTITSQIPKSGSTISKDTGKLLLYTGNEEPKNKITVPDVLGKTAEAANRMIVNLGLNIKIDGASGGEGATVISQSPSAGEVVPVGTVVTIELRHLNVTD